MGRIIAIFFCPTATGTLIVKFSATATYATFLVRASGARVLKVAQVQSTDYQALKIQF